MSLPTLLAGGVNVVPAAILVLGLGMLVHELAPRFATAVAYGVVAGSLLLDPCRVSGTGCVAPTLLVCPR